MKISPCYPYILVKSDAPVFQSGSIILRQPVAEKGIKALIIDVYEACELQPGQRLIIGNGFFKPVPGEDLLGLLDIEVGMFTVIDMNQSYPLR